MWAIRTGAQIEKDPVCLLHTHLKHWQTDAVSTLEVTAQSGNDAVLASITALETKPASHNAAGSQK